MSDQALTSALREWQARLGAANVVTNKDLLQEAATATFATHGRAHAILRPGTREEVQACLQIATRFQVPVYPFSTGKNWGYGSKAPVRDGVLIDLGRLNRILAFNEELAYVTLEPGVTQRQLHSFLREQNSRLWMDATGASPDSSIIGNTLERGFGHTPMGDHWSHVCALEVVLPTGECLETGFARFDASHPAALGRWGVGPSLDGLFSQSNLGIVTRMSVWLMPAPERFEAFFFSTNRPDGLAQVVDALRPLRLNGTVRSVMHVGNDYKVLAATTRFPFESSNGGALDAAATERFRRELNIGRWNGSGALYGTPAQVREAKKQLKRALAGKIDRLQFVDDRLLGIIRRFATPFRLVSGWDLRRVLTLLEPVYNLLQGIPTDGTLSSTYWRKRMEVPANPDPDRDRCGLLWCSPTAPNTGADAKSVTDLASKVVLRHGFEPQISVSLATERSLICVTTISYDRDVPGEDERAQACYEDLTRQMIARGYPPYRLNVASMHHMATEGHYGEVLQRIKAVVDPAGILAPGRYDAEAAPARDPLRGPTLASTR